VKLKQTLLTLLDKNDLTAAQLSRKAMVPKQNLHNWLQGAKPRDVEQIKRVADTLHVSMEYLLFGIKEKSTNPLLDKADEISAGAWEVILRKTKK
jgi:transcriptional regulator with XRE-family HTH domain